MLRFLHGAGNTTESLLLARHELVDGVTADLRVEDGEVFLRGAEPRAFGVRVGRRGVHRAEAERVEFGVMLEQVWGRRLILDVHEHGDPAPDIARVLTPLPDRSLILVAAESFATLERLHAWLPDLPIAVAISSEGGLRRYIQARMADSFPALPVVVPDALLHTADELASVRRRSQSVSVRGVRTAERAQQLERWGADAILGESLAVLAAVTAEVATTATTEAP